MLHPFPSREGTLGTLEAIVTRSTLTKNGCYFLLISSSQEINTGFVSWERQCTLLATRKKITLYYVDSIESETYEDNVKALLAGTPFYPDCSDKIESEWIRLHVREQIDGSECGARACLHGFILSSVIGEKGIDCNMSLHGDFLQQLWGEAPVRVMQHARTWARQCLAFEKRYKISDHELGWGCIV